MWLYVRKCYAQLVAPPPRPTPPPAPRYLFARLTSELRSTCIDNVSGTRARECSRRAEPPNVRAYGDGDAQGIRFRCQPEQELAVLAAAATVLAAVGVREANALIVLRTQRKHAASLLFGVF